MEHSALTRHVDEIGDVDAAEAVGRSTREDAGVVQLYVTHAQRPVVRADPVPVPAEMDRTAVLVPRDQSRRIRPDRTRKS